MTNVLDALRADSLARATQIQVAPADAPVSGWQQIVATAMSFPMEKVLKRYAADHNLPDDVVAEHERELKRYLALAAIHPNTIMGMAGPVDELWHTFLMFSREYEQFSLALCGHYIHHIPSDKDNLVELEEAKGHYKAFWNAYTEVFGEEPVKHVWPNPDTAAEAGCITCHCYVL
jgi:hypothetical protein